MSEALKFGLLSQSPVDSVRARGQQLARKGKYIAGKSALREVEFVYVKIAAGQAISDEVVFQFFNSILRMLCPLTVAMNGRLSLKPSRFVMGARPTREVKTSLMASNLYGTLFISLVCLPFGGALLSR